MDPQRVARGPLHRPGARAGVRDAAQRRRVPLRRVHHVSTPGRARRAPRTVRATATSGVHHAPIHRERAEAVVDSGHHQTQRADHQVVVPPVRDPRCVPALPVGRMVASRESALFAERLTATCRTREQVGPQPLTLHANRGSSMDSLPVALLLDDLGVTTSHSPTPSRTTIRTRGRSSTRSGIARIPRRGLARSKTHARTAKTAFAGTIWRISTAGSGCTPSSTCITSWLTRATLLVPTSSPRRTPRVPNALSMVCPPGAHCRPPRGSIPPSPRTSTDGAQYTPHTRCLQCIDRVRFCHSHSAPELGQAKQQTMERLSHCAQAWTRPITPADIPRALFTTSAVPQLRA